MPSCYAKIRKFDQSFPFKYCQNEDIIFSFKQTLGSQEKIYSNWNVNIIFFVKSGFYPKLI